PDHCVECDLFAAKLESAPGDAGNVHEIVDETRHLRDLAIDDVPGPMQLRRRRQSRPEYVDRIAYGRKRVTQLVSQSREKLVLAPIRFRKRTAHLLLLLDAAAQVLLIGFEMPPYAVQ